MLSTSGCVVSAVSSITGLLTITYTSIHGKKRAEIRKSQWSILFVFAYFCAGMGELVNVFRLFICGGMTIMDANVQIERAAYRVQSPLL